MPGAGLVAEPTAEELRWSRVAALIIAALGGLALLAGNLSGDERFAALGFIVGGPMLAVGVLTLGYSRVAAHLRTPRWRRR